MKRLLCLLSNMNAGGAETFLMKLYRGLDRTEYQMDFCVNVPEKNYYEDEIAALGGRMFRIPPRSAGIAAHDRALRDLIRKEGYRYVLAVSSSATAYLDLRTAKRAGAALCSVRSSNSNLGMSAASKCRHLLLRGCFQRWADRLIAPSDLAAIHMFGRHYDRDPRFFYLRNALAYEDFRFSPADRARIRAELSLPADCLTVGHVGRFYRQKNHSFLLEVFAALLRSAPEARLLLVGAGELEPAIREQAAALGLTERVIFAGVRADVSALLSAMDVFVFPSFFEGMPNTVIEAQASGLPCVVADTVTREADVTGLVEYLPLGDARQWAQAAIAAVRPERPDTRQAFREHQYDISRAVEQFVQIVFGETNGNQ